MGNSLPPKECLILSLLLFFMWSSTTTGCSATLDMYVAPCHASALQRSENRALRPLTRHFPGKVPSCFNSRSNDMASILFPHQGLSDSPCNSCVTASFFWTKRAPLTSMELWKGGRLADTRDVLESCGLTNYLKSQCPCTKNK